MWQIRAEMFLPQQKGFCRAKKVSATAETFRLYAFLPFLGPAVDGRKAVAQRQKFRKAVKH
jgi:hypothetical protein